MAIVMVCTGFAVLSEQQKINFSSLLQDHYNDSDEIIKYLINIEERNFEYYFVD
jgi:hypothetical protein